MRKKDIEIKTTIENMLEASSSGSLLKGYFAGLPDNQIRRAISILSGNYPVKATCSEDDFSFILYMFSTVKFMEQESFFLFVRSMNLIEFTEQQKEILRDAIKEYIEILCNVCTFELGTLLVRLFEPQGLFQYLESLAEHGNRSVFDHVYDVLKYEDFSDSNVSEQTIERFQQRLLSVIKR